MTRLLLLLSTRARSSSLSLSSARGLSSTAVYARPISKSSPAQSPAARAKPLEATRTMASVTAAGAQDVQAFCDLLASDRYSACDVGSAIYVQFDVISIGLLVASLTVMMGFYGMYGVKLVGKGAFLDPWLLVLMAMA
nr:hypothetical protein CFP56_00575 [Quercus suber]